MEAYNPAQWDNLALDNDNIYAMLQRAANPSALTLDPTRFPAPAVDNPTPPASDDSSPSPPSIKEREQFAAATSAGRATRRSTVAEDESSKRKVDDISDSDDSSYEQPSKHQHRSSESGAGASGPRRSTGGTKKKSGNPDENRALKRKEQNRAAQRAFRERKEKHVKELEDQVAALEARSNNQDRENENLRDLLGRLQNENLLLKQSAFTFSFPSGSGSGATPTATGTNTASPSSIAGPSAANRGGVPSPKMSSPSSSDASTPENTASASDTNNNPPQSSLFARPSANPTRPGQGVNGSNSSLSSDASEPSSSRFLSSPGAFGLGHNLPPNSSMDPFSGAGGGLDFGFGTDLNLLGMHNNPTSGIGGNTKTVNSAGITTIAANPMYMSFGEPLMDPMAWASFGPGDYTSPTSAVGGGGASDLDIFGVSPYGASSNGVAVNAAQRTGTGSTSDFNDLFGGAPTTGSGVTPSFLDFSGIGVSPSATGTAAGSSSAGGGTYSSPSEVNTDLTNSSAAQPQHDDGSGETCPKTVAEVQAMQKLLPASTFGPPVTVRSASSSLSQPSPPQHLQPQQSPSSSIPQLSPSHTRSTSPSASSLPQRTPDEKDHACAHARMAALCADLPRTTKKPNQIEIGRAWEKIRQHAGFEECDIDELCNELSAKARCDGSRPVLEESSFNNIVMSLGSVYKK